MNCGKGMDVGPAYLGRGVACRPQESGENAQRWGGRGGVAGGEAEPSRKLDCGEAGLRAASVAQDDLADTVETRKGE